MKTNQVAFRAPILPIRAQSLTISATKVEGGVLNITPDEYGVIENNSCGGFFNFEQGYGQFVFRKKIQITQANRPEIMSQSWYDPEMEYTDGTACVSSTGPLKPQISANLMTDCEDLKQLETGDMGEVLTWTVDTSEQYAECRAKVRSWIEVGKALE